MNDALRIFAVGLGSVFIGMLFLYIAIRLSAVAVDRLSKGDPHGE